MIDLIKYKINKTIYTNKLIKKLMISLLLIKKIEYI